VSGDIVLRNQQRIRGIQPAFLRKIVVAVLNKMPGVLEFEIGIHLVSRSRMKQMNETYLQHKGSTDVITFDYGDITRPNWLAGDIFICVSEAVDQARVFGTSWQSEVVRYVAHGILHLRGYDDHSAGEKKKMKRAEDRIVGELARDFDLKKIGKHHKSSLPRRPR
jgi:probable rRNA maturation factor